MAPGGVLVALCATYTATMAGIVVAAGAPGAPPVDQIAGPVMLIFGVVAVGFSARAVHVARGDPAYGGRGGW